MNHYIAPVNPNKVCATHSGGSVPELTLIPNKQGKVYISPISDTHFGAQSHNKELFEKHMAWVDEVGAYILIGGDMMEMALPTHIPTSVFEADYQSEEQYKKYLEYFMPRRDRLAFALSGNHDLRVWKKTGIDIVEIIADKLGCYYNRHGGYVKLNVGGQKYTFAVFHGASSGVNPYTELEKRLVTYDQADVMCIGNNHFLGDKLVVKKRIDPDTGDEVRKIIHLVRTGNFIGEPDYGRAVLYPPTPEGAPMIELDSKKHQIRVDAQGELNFV